MDEMKRNGSRYVDPTPYEAYKRLKKNRDYLARRTINAIFTVAHLAGFHVVEVVIRDSETGKEYD